MPNWDKDFNAGRTLLTMNGLPVFEAPIHLEGGSIHSDGQGTMVVTEECLLDPSRNPDLGKEGVEKVQSCPHSLACLVCQPLSAALTGCRAPQILACRLLALFQQPEIFQCLHVHPHCYLRLLKDHERA